MNVKTLLDIHLLKVLASSVSDLFQVFWKTSHSSWNKTFCKKYSNLPSFRFWCVQSSCVSCVYALHQAAGCRKAGPGPVASQEDRRGSRWICLGLTLPTPLHPLCLFQPALLSAERLCVSVVWGMGCAFMLVLLAGKLDINQREWERPCLSRISPTDPVCPELCEYMASASMLELLVCFGPLLFCYSFFSPLVHSAVWSLSQTSTLLVCPGNVLPFLGYGTITTC